MKPPAEIPLTDITDDAIADSLANNALRMNVEPLLHEIRHALKRLIDTGEASMIDLKAIPMAPGEEEDIREALGRGEVEILMDAMGPSKLYETAYPGVWWVEHRNIENELTGVYIEIAHVPEIIPANQKDLHEGLDNLVRSLTVGVE